MSRSLPILSMAYFASLRWVFALWLLFLFALAMAPLPITAALLFWNAAGQRAALIRFAVVMAIAFAMEFLENVVYHAGFEWHDIVFDAAGTLAAWAVTAVLRAARNGQGSARVLVSGQPAKLR